MLLTICTIGLLLLTWRLLQAHAAKHEQAVFDSHSTSKYARKSTVERLVAAGLYARFASAASERDMKSMVGILIQVEFGQHESVIIAEQIVAEPDKFGF